MEMRKIRQHGPTRTIALPLSYLRDLGIQDHEYVAVTLENNYIAIHKPGAEINAPATGYTPSWRQEPISRGADEQRSRGAKESRGADEQVIESQTTPAHLPTRTPTQNQEVKKDERAEGIPDSVAGSDTPTSETDSDVIQ